MPILDWVNKAQAAVAVNAVPYHLLQQQSVHGDPAADNQLIQGDNLLALKALLQFYRGRVKCVFIDPPYNTQSAFEQYDDKLEHSQWLPVPDGRLRRRAGARRGAADRRQDSGRVRCQMRSAVCYAAAGIADS